jgi:LysM repeat protein
LIWQFRIEYAERGLFFELLAATQLWMSWLRIEWSRAIKSYTKCISILFSLALLAGCGSSLLKPDPNHARLGQPLQIPSAGQSPADSTTKANQSQPFDNVAQVPAASIVDLPNRDARAVYHTVKAGDTLSQIARKHGVSLQKLVKENGLDPKAILQLGQMIYIPERP